MRGAKQLPIISMTTLLLIRHAENDYVRTGRLAGRLPGVHLNDAGRRQAQALAERLRGAPLAALYSSPLARAWETAAPLSIVARLKVNLCPGVTEIDFGRWSGRRLKELARLALWRVVQQTPSRLQFPGGESFVSAQTRAVAAVEQIARVYPKGLVGVVSHADVIKLLVAYYLGLALDHFQRLTVEPAAVTVLRLGHGGPTLVKLNDPFATWSQCNGSAGQFDL